MALDIYDNNVGNMIVLDASEAKITASNGPVSTPSAGFCTNATINYQIPIQPVATFGSDVVYAKRAPSGSFNLGTLAGSTALLDELKGMGNGCEGGAITVQFATQPNCTGVQTDSTLLNELLNGGTRAVIMYGVIPNGFTIQGQASDAFFTQNFGGFFHYLT